MLDDDAKSVAQSEAMSTPGPLPGMVYEHYKGGIYSIVARSVKEDTLEPLVTYYSNERGTYWTRTLANFTGDAEWGGYTVPRFKRVLR